jgi:hypothetical protein
MFDCARVHGQRQLVFGSKNVRSSSRKGVSRSRARERGKNLKIVRGNFSHTRTLHSAGLTENNKSKLRFLNADSSAFQVVVCVVLPTVVCGVSHGTPQQPAAMMTLL